MKPELTEIERLSIENWELRQRELVRAYEAHNAALAPVIQKIERRLRLPAGAIGTTHEVRDWTVVPVPKAEGDEATP